MRMLPLHLGLVLLLCACRGRASRGSDGLDVAALNPDSIAGRVEIIYQLHTTDPAAAYLLRPGSRKVYVAGSLETFLDMKGMHVIVFGNWMPGRPDVLVAERVAARYWDGEPAFDGILRRKNDGDFLELADGRAMRIDRLPEVLARADGLRVVVAGAVAFPTRGAIIREGPTRQPK